MAAKSRKVKKVDQSKMVTTGSNLRLEAPKSSRHRKPTVGEVAAEYNPASGFVPWLRQNAVVGLAIGFVVGTQVQVVVKQLITSFIDPLFQLVFGQQLSARVFVLSFHDRTATFDWGSFVYVLINFLFILLVIFVIIKWLRLDKLDQPKNEAR